LLPSILLSKNKKPRAKIARGHVASTSGHSLHCPAVERTEAAEIEALRSNFAAVPAQVAAEFGIASLELASGALAVRVSGSPANPFLNHALGVSTVEQVKTIAAFYGDVPHAVSPGPGVDLDAALLARGYEPGYAWMKFSRGAEPPPPAPTDLVVAEVDGNRAADFARAAVEGFGEPARFADWLTRLPALAGWHCFVAYEGQQPAAAGALYVLGELAWLGIGATVPQLRGRGAQTALLAARIRRAAELGCTLLVTETGALVDGRPSGSYRNILRAGFEPQYLRANYVPKALTRRAPST
jgi:GNAT superfamily N-acetyltransferase